MEIAERLTGGDPRTLGQTNAVVADVLSHKAKLGELFECICNKDAIVRMRACDALEKVCRTHPDWIAPYTDRLLTDVAAIDQASVQWHVAQMIGELTLSDAQYIKAVAILKQNLEHATDWIVLNYSLKEFAQLAANDATLKPYFVNDCQR